VDLYGRPWGGGACSSIDSVGKQRRIGSPVSSCIPVCHPEYLSACHPERQRRISQSITRPLSQTSENLVPRRGTCGCVEVVWPLWSPVAWWGMRLFHCSISTPQQSSLPHKSSMRSIVITSIDERSTSNSRI